MSFLGSPQGSWEDSRALASPPSGSRVAVQSRSHTVWGQGPTSVTFCRDSEQVTHLSLGLRLPNCKAWTMIIILFEGHISEDPVCFKNVHFKSHLPPGLTKKGEGTSVCDVMISKLHIWLSSIFSTELLKPLDFPHWREWT